MEGLEDVLQDIADVDEVRGVVNINRHPKVYQSHIDPFETYSEIQFRKRYRMRKETARYILNLIRDRLRAQNGNRGRPVSPEIQLMSTIRYLSKGAYEEDTADHSQFHQSTQSRIIKRVVTALAAVHNQFIKFPTTAEEIRSVKQGFYNISNFPTVVGAIDCTHIKIKNPGGEHPGQFINRKGFYSLNVQVIGDAQCRIRHIVARWRGSAHDSRIWNHCTLRREFENRQINGILLGDNGYASTNYLLTPLLNPVTEAEQRYNRSHIRTRNSVERLFGIWKNKFRCLFNGLQLDLDTTKAAIVASAVLHNICIEHRDNDSSDDENFNEENIINNNNEIQNLGGNAFRRYFINRHFNN